MAKVIGSFTLGKDQAVEFLEAYSPANAVTITGNNLANTITGGTINDFLSGGKNDDPLKGDSLAGGAGDDTYYVSNVRDVIKEGATEGLADTVFLMGTDYTLTPGAHVETIRVHQDYLSRNYTIIGNEHANMIIGGNGHDIIDGGGGADHLKGGRGNDTYFVRGDGVVIDETLADGTDAGSHDTVELQGDAASFTDRTYTLTAGLEDLDASNLEGAIILKGNELANLIIGNGAANTIEGGDGEANDTLDGGGGGDSLVGGGGDDTYRIRNAADVIVDTAGVSDRAQVYIGKYDLLDGVQIELLEGGFDWDGDGQANSVHLIGNDTANQTLRGGAAADILDGGSGGVVHTLEGGAGNDHYFIRNWDDVINGETYAPNVEGEHDKASIALSLWNAKT